MRVKVTVTQLLLKASGETLLDGEGVVLRAFILSPVVHVEVVGRDVVVLGTVVFLHGPAALLLGLHFRN